MSTESDHAHDPVFKRYPAQHREATRADIVREMTQQRTQAASVALYHAARSWQALYAELTAYRAATRRAPDAMTSYLSRSGGDRAYLRDETELLIELLAETRRARLRAELTDAQPAVVRDLYAEALTSDSDEAASVVRYIEARYALGWRGVPPESDEQIDAAAHLRRLIATTQDARVPVECDDIAASIADTVTLVDRAGDLNGIRPADPDTDLSAGAAYEAELPTWAAGEDDEAGVAA